MRSMATPVLRLRSSPLHPSSAGWLYSNVDWHKPSPYPFGHPSQPQLPPATFFGSSASDSTSGSVYALGDDDDDEDGDGGLDADGLPNELPTLSSKAGHVKKAETRKRRWLRRAVWVGVAPRTV